MRARHSRWQREWHCCNRAGAKGQRISRGATRGSGSCRFRRARCRAGALGGGARMRLGLANGKSVTSELLYPVGGGYALSHFDRRECCRVGYASGRRAKACAGNLFAHAICNRLLRQAGCGFSVCTDGYCALQATARCTLVEHLLAAVGLRIACLRCARGSEVPSMHRRRSHLCRRRRRLLQFICYVQHGRTGN